MCYKSLDRGRANLLSEGAGVGYADVRLQWRMVYNFRSEGREFTSNRCLIVADGFYE
jgi:putative SOS response-associated peptidase YedK